MDKRQRSKSYFILLVILLISTRPYSSLADDTPPATNKDIDYDYIEYVNMLGKLDKTSINSIAVAKDDLFSKFRNRTDDSKNEAFRAFRSFHVEAIRSLDKYFSLRPDNQELLDKITEATGLYNDPFPAFEKLNNEKAAEIKYKYAKTLEELNIYRKAGMNFGSSEGTWYLKEDLDFLLDVSSITTGEYRAYVRFYTEEGRGVLIDDAALMISWDDLRKRIMRWEQFAKKHPHLPETEKEVNPHIAQLVRIYLCGIDNSPLIVSGIKLNNELCNSYEIFIKEGASSAYYDLIHNVYTLWKKHDFELNEELIDYLDSHGYSGYMQHLKHRLTDKTRGSVTAQTRSENTVANPLIVPLLIVLLVIFISSMLLKCRKRKNASKLH